MNQKDLSRQACHCEDGILMPDAAIQSFKSGLPRKIEDFSRSDRKCAAFTLSCKTFRSNLLTAMLRSRLSRFSLTKFRSRAAHSYGFTLAETLITLTILGVIAAITVPSLINKQIESANRTKLKKAMTVYEKALNQMIIDNDLKTNNAIKTEFNNDNCATSSTYFKPVETVSGNACRFKTADRVWWDITDIEAPIISLKDEIKTDANATAIKANAESLNSDHTSFIMIGYLDDTTGVLRINDFGVAKDGDTIPTAKNKTYLSKVYELILNKKFEISYSYSYSFSNELNKYKNGDFNKECVKPNLANYVCTNCVKCKITDGGDIQYYDSNGNVFMYYTYEPSNIPENIAYMFIDKEINYFCNSDMSLCSFCTDIDDNEIDCPTN